MNLLWKCQKKFDPELGEDSNTPTLLSLAAHAEGLPTRRFEMLYGNLCQLFSLHVFKDTDATRMYFVHRLGRIKVWNYLSKKQLRWAREFRGLLHPTYPLH